MWKWQTRTFTITVSAFSYESLITSSMNLTHHRSHYRNFFTIHLFLSNLLLTLINRAWRSITVRGSFLLFAYFLQGPFLPSTCRPRFIVLQKIYVTFNISISPKHITLILLSSQLYTFVFYKKVIYKKAVLDCSKSSESSIPDFWELRKSINSYTLKFPIFTQAYHLFDLSPTCFLC